MTQILTEEVIIFMHKEIKNSSFNSSRSREWRWAGYLSAFHVLWSVHDIWEIGSI